MANIKSLKDKDGNEIFPKIAEESISITNYTDLISSVEIGNFQKKQISSSIYGYKLQINLIGNFTKNTKYLVFHYPFSIIRAGTIVRYDNTHQIGSYIINDIGFWVNFSEDITASTANKIFCTTMTEIGF